MKPEERRLSAITQVKVLSPEMEFVAQGQRVCNLEASIAAGAIGEPAAACRGLSPWQAIELSTSELGRAMPFPKEASNKLKRRRRRYGGMAVGPAHSRGVAGVMPGAGECSLEGAGGKTQRDEEAQAVH